MPANSSTIRDVLGGGHKQINVVSVFDEDVTRDNTHEIRGIDNEHHRL